MVLVCPTVRQTEPFTAGLFLESTTAAPRCALRNEKVMKPHPNRKFGIEEVLILFVLAFAVAWFSFGLITLGTWAFETTERLQVLTSSQTDATSAIPERTQPSKLR